MRASEQSKLTMLDPNSIRNTQSTVYRTFSNGGLVMQAMIDIVQGRRLVQEETGEDEEGEMWA